MEIAMDIKISLEAKYQVLRELMEHIEQTPQKVFEAALTLTAIRDAIPNDIAFRDELDEQGIAINKDDRAAMIRFGRASDSVQYAIKHFMRKEGRTSFRYLPSTLWEEGSLCSETSPSECAKPEIVQIQPELPEELATPQIETVEKTKVHKSPPTKAAIFGLDRADEVWSIISPWISSARTGVNDLHKKEGWPMLLECIDLGLFVQDGVGAQKPNGRAIVNLPMSKGGPSVAELSRFDLSKLAVCKKAQETLMPFLRKNAEALKADPESFAKLWAEESRSKRDEIIKAEQEDKYAKTMAEIASRGEKEVIVCGVKVWPSKHTNFTSFSYEQLRLAWFMFLDGEKIAEANLWSKEGRKGRAIAHRWLIKNYKRSFAAFKDKPGCEELVEHAENVGLAWHELSMALQDGPDEKLQTSIPFTDITAI
jgi:hypothetical protein